MQCLFPIFCTLLNRADDKCIFKRHIFAFWVDLDIIAEIGFVAQGILKCARTSSLTSTTLKTTLTEVQYYLGLQRQHRRQRWEKRPFEISGSLIFGSLWESNLKYDKKWDWVFGGRESLYIRSSWMKLDIMGWNETIIVFEYFWSQDFFVHWSFGFFFRDICPFECGKNIYVEFMKCR